MDYKPDGYTRAQNGLERVFRDMDFHKKREQAQNQKPKVNGPKAEFLQEYEKNGYSSAKELIDSTYGEVFGIEILLSWLGITNLRQILIDAYNGGNIEEAYRKAEEINKKVKYEVLKKEYIDNLIKEEFEIGKEKLKIKLNDRNEDDKSK